MVAGAAELKQQNKPPATEKTLVRWHYVVPLQKKAVQPWGCTAFLLLFPVTAG